jgi:hypoxanthine phosphoribosyltransferase
VVARLGAEIAEAHPSGVLLVGVLPGAVPFLADLVRAVLVPSEVDFLSISPFGGGMGSPFGGGTGRVRLTLDLDLDIHQRDVVVVEEIVDTGLTLNYVLSELRARQPRSLRACALVDRTRRRLVPVKVDYRGLDSDEDLLLGYGLGHGGRYANLAGLYAVEASDLSSHPDRHVAALYGTPHA